MYKALLLTILIGCTTTSQVIFPSDVFCCFQICEDKLGVQYIMVAYKESNCSCKNQEFFTFANLYKSEACLGLPEAENAMLP